MVRQPDAIADAVLGRIGACGASFGVRRHPVMAQLCATGDLPHFDGATGWLNSPPLTPADLRGKGRARRLLDLHLHQLAPHARLRARLGGEVPRSGLVVVGVHTPEFPFERDIDNVREAAKDMRVEYPIALDSDYGVWRAFGNRYWPAVYIADAEGRIRHHHFGEGEYDECEWVDSACCCARPEPRASATTSSPSSPTASRLKPTGRTWARPRRTSATSKGRTLRPRWCRVRRAWATYAPDRCGSTSGLSPGDWTIESRASVLNRADGRIAFRFHARDVHLVLRAACARHVRAVPRARRRRTSRRRSWARRRRAGPRNPGPAAALSAGGERASITDRTFEITFLAPGVEAYVFTFG